MLRGMIVVGVLALNLAPAHADELHYDVGFGTAQVSGDLAGHLVADGQVGGRIVAGKRIDDWSVDGVFFGTDLTPAARPGDGTHSTLSLGIEARRYARVLQHLELYARAGIDYTWLVQCSATNVPPGGYSGRGYHYGAGLQLTWTWRIPRRSKLRYGRARVFVDLGRQVTRLQTSGAKPLDAGIQQLIFGFGISFGY